MPLHPIVVVIEDQPELRHVIRDVLRGEEFEVVPVSDKQEAIAALRDRRVSLLVSDLPTAEGSGGDPLDEITDEFPELPVIVLSGYPDDAVPFFGPWRVEGKRMMLRRPFKLDDLISASREVVG